ncbi:MAG: tRNA (guanosine(37)-N1)-methyltransferase TrmD [Pyrinomonadaceae bacterium]|nr:tRNA (guanosine(37)-N1)-methyltransferase TrmD [Phycisphaerales bacterium]
MTQQDLANAPPTTSPQRVPLRIDVLTTFPELFGETPGCFLASSIPARARRAGIVEYHATDIRSFATGKHQKTDDRPFGGGPGMVMLCQPLWDAVQAVEAADPRPVTRIVLTPQGVPLTQPLVEELSTKPRLLMIAGHYEGIDERVIERLAPMEISVGDYVLSGGELGALVLIDAIVRLLPGSLGHEDSASEDSFSKSGPAGQRLLDCPHYTKPREWEGMSVPEVLFSGDHGAVDQWRHDQRVARTRARRPDLLTAKDESSLQKHRGTEECKGA